MEQGVLQLRARPPSPALDRGTRTKNAREALSGRSRMEPFHWRRTFFIGLVSYAAPLSGLVFDTFVPVLL
jgi:hypothetical protein